MEFDVSFRSFLNKRKYNYDKNHATEFTLGWIKLIMGSENWGLSKKIKKCVEIDTLVKQLRIEFRRVD